MDRWPHVLVEAPITFDVAGGRAHCPMVHVSVGDSRTKLILDTGSTAHVLTIALANEAGLRSEPDEPGTDHAGKRVPSWALGDVRVEIEDCALTLRRVAAIAGPPSFEGWGIGGFLSPQNLHPVGFVVMDLVENKLILVDVKTPDVADWLRARYPTMTLHSLQRQQGEGVFVHASVEPFPSVMTMVNTGTNDTEFARAAVPGLRGVPPESAGLGVTGAEVLGEEVPGQTIRLGGARLPVPVLFVREQMPREHGLAQLGMNVLLGTVLAIGADATQPVHWLVPDASGAHRLSGPKM